MKLEIIPAYDHAQEIKALFTEYTDMLTESDSAFKEYLRLQKYDEEIKHLDRKYGLPHGRLYLAYCDGEPAGCIGLRKLDDENCEMKRLYVRPRFRGLQIGTSLVQKIMEDAREIGYSHILLDTLPFLETAIHMYQAFGFYKIERYNNNPLQTSVYMKFDLAFSRNHIRKATLNDVSRIAEILVFTKRMNYHPIFQNDKVSFGEIQVLPVAQEYIDHPESLEHIWVYDDEFVKGILHVEGERIQELYVDTFFQNQGIGAGLISFAVQKCGAKNLFVLEKNSDAIRFYQKHGFSLTGDRQLEPGTTEYIVKMER